MSVKDARKIAASARACCDGERHSTADRQTSFANRRIKKIVSAFAGSPLFVAAAGEDGLRTRGDFECRFSWIAFDVNSGPIARRLSCAPRRRSRRPSCRPRRRGQRPQSLHSRRHRTAVRGALWNVTCGPTSGTRSQSADAIAEFAPTALLVSSRRRCVASENEVVIFCGLVAGEALCVQRLIARFAVGEVGESPAAGCSVLF